MTRGSAVRCRRATGLPSRPWMCARALSSTNALSTLSGRGFLDTEFFHSAIEGGAAHAELACRMGHVVTVLGYHAFDGGSIEHRFIGARLQHRWEIEQGGGNRTGAREQGGALQHVAKLADISWPGMIEQRAFGVTREARSDRKERACQRQHVVAPLGEWRQRELDDAQAVVQVFTETPFTHRV